MITIDIFFDGCRKVGVAGLAAVARCVLASEDAEPIVIAVTEDSLKVLGGDQQIPIGELLTESDDEKTGWISVDDLRR